jgi:hypothetical protein
MTTCAMLAPSNLRGHVEYDCAEKVASVVIIRGQRPMSSEHEENDSGYRHDPHLVTAAGVRLSLRGDCRNRRRDAVTARSLMLYWPVRYLSRCWQLRLVITQLRWRWA